MKKKLFIAGMTLLLAVVLLATASFAWFSISTNPEVGMQLKLYTDRTVLLAQDVKQTGSERAAEGSHLIDGTTNLSKLNFQQYVDLSADFDGIYQVLRPVSTADGINWFIPTYDTETGLLNDVKDFINDTGLNYANISVYDSNGNVLTDAQKQIASAQSYYVYTDFWMKTEEECGARVRLSIPHKYETSDGQQAYYLDDSETEYGVYGTYVISKEKLNAAENGLEERNQKPEAAVRIGLMVYEDAYAADDTLGDPTNFVIYEPNADMRSDTTKMESLIGRNNGGAAATEEIKKEDYVVGYDINTDTQYLDNYYYVTQPIGIGRDGKGMITELDPDKLIVQKRSAWDTSRLLSSLQAGNTGSSNDIAAFGDFLKSDSRFTHVQTASDTSTADTRYFSIADEDLAENGLEADIAGSTVIVTLEKDKPVKVRLFVWIEGQDVDCWNDIAAGTFKVNLELAGESIIPTAEDASE